MPAERIADSVHWLRLGLVNAYLVAPADQPAVLVDSGLPGHLPAILGVLAELDLIDVGLQKPSRASRLSAILLTHRHLDHTGSAAALAARTGAEVLVHEADADAVQGRARLSPTSRGLAGSLLGPLVAFSDHRIFRFRPCEQLTRIVDGWRGLPGWLAVHLPGHTPGHCAFVYEPASVAFCGDLAVSRGGGTLGQPSSLFSVAPADLHRSQRRLAAVCTQLDIDRCCFGHGPPTTRASAELRRLAG